ncbi:hypothetical protein ANCCEY_13603 [Ancylostoma ceylanicum]|uniref:Uncharacterized protein n=1 Tax=Ancylostoma ceylanicum TaxID=53326 RepID=A0A0D6L8G3_9BILA|nr:hypothetical protein ANCCEY_13603 [Ancylostoma ceylanicum]
MDSNSRKKTLWASRLRHNDGRRRIIEKTRKSDAWRRAALCELREHRHFRLAVPPGRPTILGCGRADYRRQGQRRGSRSNNRAAADSPISSTTPTTELVASGPDDEDLVVMELMNSTLAEDNSALKENVEASSAKKCVLLSHDFAE